MKNLAQGTDKAAATAKPPAKKTDKAEPQNEVFPPKKELVAQLIATGISYQQAAREAKVPKGTVCRWMSQPRCDSGWPTGKNRSWNAAMETLEHTAREES